MKIRKITAFIVAVLSVFVTLASIPSVAKVSAEGASTVVINIMNEWSKKEYGYELSIRADILKVFLWVLRYWHKHELNALSQFDYSDESLRIIQQALEYISKKNTFKAFAYYCIAIGIAAIAFDVIKMVVIGG